MNRIRVRTTLLTTIAAAGLVTGAASIAGAQTTAPKTTPETLKMPGDSPAPTTVTKAGTMQLLTRPITVKFTETRLEACIKFVEEITGAPIEVYWADGNSEGLDKELLITMDIKGVPALNVLERLLDKAKTDFSENTWQMTEEGSVECGPKTILNRHKRLAIYDIHDMLFEIGRYEQVPQIDLQSLLQQSQGGGGGGGQNPFRDDQDQQRNQNREESERRARERADEIVALLTSLVEPEQWSDAGGDGGTVRLFQKTIIVNAPDYMHRALDGYKWWSAGHKAYKIADRRYVSLNMGAENGTVDGIRNFPVSAVVGGRVISSDPSKNPPGGNKAPADAAKKTDKKTDPKKTKPAPKKTEPAKKPEEKK